MNQLGSVLYYYSLAKTGKRKLIGIIELSLVFQLDFSTAVPVTNALTLLITYLCDVISRPQLLNSRKQAFECSDHLEYSVLI